MRKISFLICLIVSTQLFVQAQNVPTPKSHFGFSIGENYHLATFTQTEAYLKKIAATTKKVKLQVIGKTEEGRNQYMVIVSDPTNIANLGLSLSQRFHQSLLIIAPSSDVGFCKY